MSIKVLQNFYKATITQNWATGTGNRYVSVKPTVSAGWLVISPASSNLREIIAYTSTGTDGSGDYVVVSARGVGGTTEQTHTVNEPIRMNYTAEHQDEISDALDAKIDISAIDTDPTMAANSDSRVPSQKGAKAYIDNIAIAGAPTATPDVKGIGYLSVAASGTTIFVGDNDPRVPTQDENDALAGTSGTPGSANKYVTSADTGTTITAGIVVRRKATTGGIAVPTTPTDAEDAGSKSYIDTGDAASVNMLTGTRLFASNNTGRAEVNSTYTKHKGITVYRAGTYSVKFTLASSDGTNNAYGRIYVNGVAVGTERRTASGAEVFTEDITVVVGDEIQIYIKWTGTGGQSAAVSNFQLYVYRFDGSSNTYDA